jgi:hypothetical protein
VLEAGSWKFEKLNKMISPLLEGCLKGGVLKAINNKPSTINH